MYVCRILFSFVELFVSLMRSIDLLNIIIICLEPGDPILPLLETYDNLLLYSRYTMQIANRSHK
jgi:hypothetical protein